MNADDGDASLDVHDIFWESPRIDITEREVVARIACSDSGATAGQTIRLAIRQRTTSG